MVNGDADKVWVVVEVWRGLANRTRVFKGRSEAQRLYKRLRRECKLDEDDVQLFETQIISREPKGTLRR